MNAGIAVSILIFSVLTGICDALGLMYASQVWQNGLLNINACAKSVLSFAFGILLYWTTLRPMQAAGIHRLEIQSLIWLCALLVGIMILGGNWRNWNASDWLAAAAVVFGLAWLITRHAS